MDVVTPLACALLLAGCGYYIGRPLMGRRSRSVGGSGAHQLAERKEQLYAAILELEFDRELGKLPDEDFQRMRDELEEEALDVIHQLDQLNGRTEGDDVERRIEEELARMQAQSPLSATASPPVEETAQNAPNQGTPPAPQANFCGQCGTKRREADRFCPQCGNAFAETT